MTDIPPISVIQAQLGIGSGFKKDHCNFEKFKKLGKCSALTTAFPLFFLNQAFSPKN